MDKNYYEPFGGGVFGSSKRSVVGGSTNFSMSMKFDRRLSDLFEQAAAQAPYALRKALDEVGNKTRTQVIKATAKQAGVKQARVRNVIATKQAMGAGAGQYVMTARDVTLSLKEFSPRQTKRGVTAAPWGRRQVFPHTFIGPNGHVFARRLEGNKRAGRVPIYKLYGPAIPSEMVKDEAEKAFYSNVEKLFPAAIEKWLLRQLK
ncbi:hypothetical protein [Methylocystis parvus]|uniref:Uncharacterized protein n=1 Tax=Methylocystis parvus TaxID=134 RepID=A0A6B8LZE0_9HYPH|nr:hypothetical protein [Methylocystis parvus]QGM97797.1 hypothetical protein F7D14_10175 [Methylocystis parvus]WBK01895.1 phage tail protein [Methylocystis parvus OBBP]